MTTRSNKTSLRLFGNLRIWALFSMFALAASLVAQSNSTANPPQPWVAPDSAKAVKNPLPPTAQNVSAGKDLYLDNCLMCHGEKGEGDGIAAQTLAVKPANLTDAKLMKGETDGALFWKMSNGRGPMPSWKDNFSETQRWQLVDYIRTFAKGPSGDTAADHPATSAKP